MKIRYWIFQVLIGILAFPMLSVAQTIAIKGAIIDSATGKPVQDVTIALLKDSKTVVSSFSDEKGLFTIADIPKGNYQLYVTLIGYRSHYTNLSVNGSIDLGQIPISNKSITLNTIEIKQSIPPITIKKDTVEFNASTIKTRPNAATEELLKRIPGISIDQNGKITAMGEAVKRILVDGKPFFGDNVNLTTKNLPAEIIDKIQLIDGKPDETAFSGFDDGKREKVINITLKKNRRRGTTGNASLGYGNNDRYAASTNLNSFNERDRLSLIGNGNNLNDRYFNPGSNFAGMSPGNGLTSTWSGAANYNLAERNKLRVDASYDIAKTKTQNHSNSARQTFLPDTSWYYNQQSENNTKSTTQSMHMRVNYRIDSSQFIVINPELSYATNNNIQQNNYQSMNSEKDTSIIGNSLNGSQTTNPDFNLNAFYRKQFNKAGRTFSAHFNIGSSGSNGSNTFQTKDKFLTAGYVTGYNRLISNNNRDNNLGLRISYTTPIFTNHQLQLSYAWNDQFNKTVNKTYDIDTLSGKYENLNDSLTNTAKNTFQSQSAGFNIRADKCGYDYTIGMNIQYSAVNNNNSNNPSFSQHYINLFPTAKLNIKIAKDKNFRLSYDGNTIRPSIDQLQPLPNLSNSLLVKEGNPDLKPSFRHGITLGYNSFNPSSFHGLFIFINSEFIANKVINVNTYDSSGRQYTKPTNANGAFNLNGSITNSMNLPNINTTLALSSGFLYNRDITFTNIDNKNLRSYTHSYNLNEVANINYRYKSLLEINTSFQFIYAGNRYATTSNNNLTYNITLNYNISLPAGFLAGNDLRYIINRGRSAGYNNSTALLNGFIAKSLFKQKQALIKIYAYDILHQNVSISRNVGDNFIEDVQQTVLKPYWMLSFTWFLKNFPAGKSEELPKGV